MGPLAATLAALALAAAPEGTNPFVAQARELYQKLEFEKCLARLAQASQLRSNPKDLVDLELYAGLCHYGLGHREDAEERFKLALRIDGDLELPPYTSPKAVDLFLKVKKSLVPIAPPLPDQDLPPLDGERPPQAPDKSPDPPPAKSPDAARPPDPGTADAPRATALAPPQRPPEPPGVTRPPGFFQRKAAPLAVAGGAAVALGFGIGFGASAKGLEAQARADTFESDFLAHKRDAETQATVANVAFGVAATAGVTALILFLVSD